MAFKGVSASGVSFEDELRESLPPSDGDEGMSADEYLDLPIDHEQDEETRKELLLPAGAYITQPPLQYKTFDTKDGRRVLSFFGAASKQDGTKEGKIRFRISPQKGYKMDEFGVSTDKVAWDHQLYLKMKDAYKTAVGEFPTNARQLVNYLEEYPVQLTVIQGTDSNIVVGIQAIKS